MPAARDTKPAVLIVEDEYIVAMHMALMINDLGYNVVGIAVDRQSALQMATQNPDIVLVDCKLRDGVTGPVIGRHIATQTDARVIYITANPQYVSGPEQRHPAILGIHPKPVNDNELGEILEFAMKARAGKAPEKPPVALRPLSH